MQLTVPVTHLPMCHHPRDLSVATCGCYPLLCLSVGWWPQRRPHCGHLWPSPIFMWVTMAVVMEVTSVWPPVPVAHLATCHHPGGRIGNVGVVPCHLSRCVSVCWWHQRGPQCGCLSPSAVSVCVTVPVAVEGTSVWVLVPVTCLAACHNHGGHRGDLSMATCPHHPPLWVSVGWWPRRRPPFGHMSLSPVLLCVTVLVATEGTLAQLTVPITYLPACHRPSGRGGDLAQPPVPVRRQHVSPWLRLPCPCRR